MRKQVQSKLVELTDIDVGEFRADDILETGETYFGYQLTNNYIGTDSERTYTMQCNINGYISRLDDKTENTLSIIDNARALIIEKLKELGFRTTYEDVSINNGIRKIHITGRTVAQDDIIIGGE